MSLGIKQRVRLQEITDRKDLLLKFCADNGIGWSKLAPYQYRIYFNDGSVDFYPNSSKICQVGTGIFQKVDVQDFLNTKKL